METPRSTPRRRAMRIVRANAAEWKLDPARVGFVGLSSGGHFASMVGTNFKREVHASRDDWDKVSARPDFPIPGYGPRSSNARVERARPSRRSQSESGRAAPKTGTLRRAPDRRANHAGNSARLHLPHRRRQQGVADQRRPFYLGMKKAKLPAELHICRHGLHGVAIRDTGGPPVADWPRAAAGGSGREARWSTRSIPRRRSSSRPSCLSSSRPTPVRSGCNRWSTDCRSSSARRSSRFPWFSPPIVRRGRFERVVASPGRSIARWARCSSVWVRGRRSSRVNGG